MSERIIHEVFLLENVKRIEITYGAPKRDHMLKFCIKLVNKNIDKAQTANAKTPHSACMNANTPVSH